MVKRNNLGVSFLSLLGLLFIGLKLTGHITWSWALILLPLYGPVVLGFVVFAILAAIVLASAIYDNSVARKRR